MDRYIRSTDDTCVNTTHLRLNDGSYQENSTACENATIILRHEDSRAPAILFMFAVCALGGEKILQSNKFPQIIDVSP